MCGGVNRGSVKVLLDVAIHFPDKHVTLPRTVLLQVKPAGKVGFVPLHQVTPAMRQKQKNNAHEVQHSGETARGKRVT